MKPATPNVPGSESRSAVRHMMKSNNLWTSCALMLHLAGCASMGGSEAENYSTINGGDYVQEVRPDIYLIISKSGYYIPDEADPLLVVDKLITKLAGQGPEAARKRWEARANIVCGAEGYRAYKIEAFTYSANTGPYPRWIAAKSAYAVCNRKNYSDSGLKALFPYW